MRRKLKMTNYKLTDADFKQINKRSLFGFQLG
ncbi:MAG: PTS system mannose/fructose/sorbose family transporter subunit IID, partial [Lactobacillaceae bacterium]